MPGDKFSTIDNVKDHLCPGVMIFGEVFENFKPVPAKRDTGHGVCSVNKQCEWSP